NVRETLAYAKDKVDLAVISSSNLSAITGEWNACGLIEYPSFITSQEIGTKDDCIARILKKGYRKEDVLMVGDAYPDVHAATSNGVWYYPILVRHEAESWAELKEKYLPLFLEDRFGTVQEELLARFYNNFSTSRA
ncbi:MAG: HAD family hydrolase, partial [Clostridiales bacterium]|nr:HAD family hydrolase [Clostridiales bacterium]